MIGVLLCAALSQFSADEPGKQQQRDKPEPAIDIAAEAGIFEQTHSFSANVGDYNADGWDDVLIVRHRFGHARLYRNDHGRFTEIGAGTFPAALGANHDRHDCAWGDVNQDELLDVFCSIGAAAGRAQKSNELWMQVSPGKFRDQARRYGVVDEFGRGRQSTFIDVNHDVWPDLFIGNEPVRQDTEVSPNRLLINDGGVRFVPADSPVLEQQLGGRSVQAVDYDGDRWEDLLICAEAGLRLYRNDHGEFTDVSAASGALRPCLAAVMADFDGDGDVDIAAASPDSLAISLQEDGVFQPPVYRRETDRANAIASGDFDGDGDLDVYLLLSPVTGGNTPDLLLLNRGTGEHWQRQPMPTTTEGVGDHVATIDSDRDGRDEFLVLNGRGDNLGPVQLIAAPGKAEKTE